MGEKFKVAPSGCRAAFWSLSGWIGRWIWELRTAESIGDATINTTIVETPTGMETPTGVKPGGLR